MAIWNRISCFWDEGSLNEKPKYNHNQCLNLLKNRITVWPWRFLPVLQSSQVVEITSEQHRKDDYQHRWNSTIDYHFRKIAKMIPKSIILCSQGLVPTFLVTRGSRGCISGCWTINLVRLNWTHLNTFDVWCYHSTVANACTRNVI